jgi:hypothetical protein
MFKKWFASMRDTMFLTPLKARDTITNCFYTAQKETFARMKEKTNPYVSDPEIKKTVIAGIRAVFKEIGADFDHPRSNDLVKVVEILSVKAKSWGTPDDIIEHHKEQIKKVLDALQKAS